MSLPCVPIVCPRCQGFVMQEPGEAHCLNCAWRPRFPSEPDWTERHLVLDPVTANRLARQSAKAPRPKYTREERKLRDRASWRKARAKYRAKQKAKRLAA